MLRWLLRTAAIGLYVAFLAVVFVASAYYCFNLFVRRGGTRVPQLTGLEVDEAGRRLAAQGLRMRREAERDRFSADVPAGAVLEQRPAGGTPAKEGGIVDVVVSRGSQTVIVPDLLGQALQTAQVTVAANGLLLGRTLTVFADRREGAVAEQTPPPGAEVAYGSTVDVFVAADGLGETWIMPDLTYRDYVRVRASLERNGFRVGSVKFGVYEGIQPGAVLRQFPPPGHPLHREEAISLVVAAPSELTPEEAL